MPISVAAMYRYPVKGLSPEPLARLALSPGKCVPQDRRFAIALPTTQFDPANPQWLSKTHFIMLMRDAALARWQTRFDEASGVLTIARDGETALEARLSDPEGRRRVCDFYAEALGIAGNGPLRVVEAPGHAFADARRKPNATADQYVSLINRASIAALGTAIGASVDPLRFRANVYFDGAPAWQENGWIGSELTLGTARLRVVSAITRCAATQVNPATAARDLDIPAGLQRHFGHNLMGIYAEVVAAGEIALGDAGTVFADPSSAGTGDDRRAARE